MIDFFEATKTLLEHDYIFGKTMPDNPHWYTLRKTWNDDQLFDQVVDYIRKNSYPEKYKGSTYRMFLLNEFKYWTMGAPIPQTVLINRTLHDEPNDYDLIAPVYDELFADEISKAELRELFSKLDIRGSVLDIGCGTGLFLDYFIPQDYTGIDPSKEMLRVFKEKHPDSADRVIKCKFENYSNGSFDTIVSLNGSPSYIEPECLYRIKQMLNPEGKAYLMFYKNDYTPDIYNKAGKFLNHFPNTISGEEFHNFTIVSFYRL